MRKALREHSPSRTSRNVTNPAKTGQSVKSTQPTRCSPAIGTDPQQDQFRNRPDPVAHAGSVPSPLRVQTGH